MKIDKNKLPSAYEGVERHLMALFYSGVYITNADIVEIGKSFGLDLPLKDRVSLLSKIIHYAHENNIKPQIMQKFIELLKKRVKIYSQLSQDFPATTPIVQNWIQKANSTILLLQREIRGNLYE